MSWRSLAISFDPFDAPMKEISGDPRGILFPALAVAFGFVGLAVLMVVALQSFAPAELTPLHVSDAQMRQFADAGRFPLIAAAMAGGRKALGMFAGLQTFAAFALFAIAGAYFGWRGFASRRVRGWSYAVLITGVAFVCVGPSLFPNLTLHRLDYTITTSSSRADMSPTAMAPLDAIYGAQGLNRHMLPGVFLVERGLFGALVAGFVALCLHDAGYRLREAMEDFGLIDAEARLGAGSRSAPPAGPSGAAPREEGSEQGFGQRAAPPPAGSAVGPLALARATLGVAASASRREIERAYRAQMKRAHPDHGGSVERAAALNAARDELMRRG